MVVEMLLLPSTQVDPRQVQILLECPQKKAAKLLDLKHIQLRALRRYFEGSMQLIRLCCHSCEMLCRCVGARLNHALARRDFTRCCDGRLYPASRCAARSSAMRSLQGVYPWAKLPSSCRETCLHIQNSPNAVPALQQSESTTLQLRGTQHRAMRSCCCSTICC